MDGVVMPEAVPGNRFFTITQHPLSMKLFGWTRQYKQARVFCFPSGHGYVTCADTIFRAVLANGIRWTVEI